MILSLFAACYTYKYNGGCATEAELYPKKLLSKKVGSIPAQGFWECYSLCKTTPNCKYFEYDAGGLWCHLHPGTITRGNWYHNVKCYEMSGKYSRTSSKMLSG